MDLTDTDLSILISCVGKQITRFDETWGDPKWRRENKIDPKAAYYQAQLYAREEEDNLFIRLREESMRRKDNES
jgi:hypothetical protein